MLLVFDLLVYDGHLKLLLLAIRRNLEVALIEFVAAHTALDASIFLNDLGPL